MTTLDTIKAQIAQHPVLLYMKGTPEQPRCGFSATAVKLIRACGVSSFASVDVLAHPDIRATLPSYAQWPTFPQLYVNGTLLGGADILQDMYQSGQLQQRLAAHAQAVDASS